MKGKRKIVKIISLFLAITAVTTMCGCGGPKKKTKFNWIEREGLGTEVTVKELDPQMNGKYYYTEGDVANFGFSAGGITFGFKGSELWLDLCKCGSYVAAYVDDMEQILVIANEEGYLKVVDGLDPDKIHEVTLGRRNEGNGAFEGSTKIAKIKISEGGQYYVKKYEKTRRRIEVLGDSICCGFGNLYEGTVIGVPDMEDGTRTFATMIADYYDADLTCACISGIGIGNKANSPYALMGPYRYDNGEEHDFTKNIPDVVIIELGENDTACGNTGDEFVENAKEYIDFIRGNYPDATIIWYYGIMGASLKDKIAEIVKEYNDAGDKNIYCLFTEKSADEPEGCYGHPSVVTHERMAKELEKFINKHVKW